MCQRWDLFIRTLTYFTNICYLPGTLLGTHCTLLNTIVFCPQEMCIFMKKLSGQCKQNTIGERESVTSGKYFFLIEIQCNYYERLHEEFWVLLVQHINQSSTNAWRREWWIGSDFDFFQNRFWNMGKDSLIKSPGEQFSVRMHWYLVCWSQFWDVLPIISNWPRVPRFFLITLKNIVNRISSKVMTCVMIRTRGKIALRIRGLGIVMKLTPSFTSVSTHCGLLLWYFNLNIF